MVLYCLPRLHACGILRLRTCSMCAVHSRSCLNRYANSGFLYCNTQSRDCINSKLLCQIIIHTALVCTSKIKDHEDVWSTFFQYYDITYIKTSVARLHNSTSRNETNNYTYSTKQNNQTQLRKVIMKQNLMQKM